MNKVILAGRLTRDPDVRYSQGSEPMAVARYTLAVDRRYKKDENSTDFISCVAFGKTGEFVEKYLKKGMKMIVYGRIQTGSYTNKDGVKVYTTDVVVEEHEFAESKASGAGSASNYAQSNDEPRYNDMNSAPAASSNDYSSDDFMTIPNDVDEQLPF